MQTMEALVGMCLALTKGRAGITAAERRLANAKRTVVPSPRALTEVRAAIKRGEDPLGDAFTLLRSPVDRRASGAVYTPATIVRSMTNWVGSQVVPARVVDPGAGSGRFIIAAGEAFPKAELVAAETDPLAALMLRANLHARGWSDRTRVLVQDYRSVSLPKCGGVTAFIGNPPYVRHHDISPEWKAWYARAFSELGIKASALAGLHLHFFLQTFKLARAGDIGAFITSAEWMDVNYGSALRRLLLERLGAVALHVLEPTVEAFPGTATTAAITCFKVGKSQPTVRARSVDDLAALNGLSKGVAVPRSTFEAASRWSVVVRPSSDRGGVELGELFRAHRGQVTGANSVWIAGDEAIQLPDALKVPTVTKARDLIAAGERLRNAWQLRRVIDIPSDLDELAPEDRRAVAAFLRWAKSQGADMGYIARHRKAWWSVGLRAPAPVLCTYMARRPPQFTLNDCAARHINIAHGLYPRQDVPPERLAAIVGWLNENTQTGSGRTYAGGLTKFEPKEIERLRVPSELIG
jgi:N-6 DNA Methylase